VSETIDWRPADHREDSRALDIIGDVHGCADELADLLAKLGYGVALEGRAERRRALTSAPKDRIAVFVGDLVDRGPKSPDVLRIVMAMVAAGHALCVPGNHDSKFLRWMLGRDVKLSHGLDRTVAQMAEEPPAFKDIAKAFLLALPLYLRLDGGALAVAHAGIKEDMIGQHSDRIRRFCIYGDAPGGTDAFGLSIRYHWALQHDGPTHIVYGHTPVPQVDWVNRTLCIDTGCCFGGALTALRWPERETVSVPARAAYAERQRPFGHPPPRPGIEAGE
jgi:protein phosphatase